MSGESRNHSDSRKTSYSKTAAVTVARNSNRERREVTKWPNGVTGENGCHPKNSQLHDALFPDVIGKPQFSGLAGYS